jgi:hypothetical protein
MSSQDVLSPTELRDQIDAFQKERLPQIPPSFIALAQRTTNELIATGIEGRSLKVGDKAPDFVLPNVRGAQVRFSDMLAKGPAVVVFYRGGW